MNILFLSTWFPYPPNNGSKLRAYYLLQALERAGQVTLISFHPQGTGTPARSGYDQTTTHVVVEDPFRHTNRSRVLKYLSPIPLAYWPSRAMSQTVRRVSAATRWDAVVALQMPVARYALQVDARARILDVDTSLSYWAFEALQKQAEKISYWHYWVSWQKGYHYERRWLSRFALGTLVSPVEVDYLRRMVAVKKVALEVVPNGVDCSHNRPGLVQPQPATLVFNGSLTYSANYDAIRWFLTQVWPCIRAQIPDATLTITGSTAGVELSGMALDDHVRLTGFVEDVRIPVAEATVAVAPIRQGGGTRLKILEAMALGTPVVATTKGAEGLDIVDGEHFLCADDPNTFAARTVILLQDADLRHQVADNARRLVETAYDWSHIGAHFVTLVESAVENA